MSAVIQQHAVTSLPMTSQRDHDFDLLQRIARKDKRALKEMYLAYYRRIFQFVFRMVHKQEVAEEIVNDVMFVVWQQAKSFKGQSKPSTWLLGIAYRKSLKALRSSKRDSTRTMVNEEAIVNTPDSNSASYPESSYADAEFSEDLKTGLDSLSEQHRSVVALTALGHSYVEIAKIVDCPVNTVKTRMFYARRQLKQILTEMHTDPVTQQDGQSI